MPSEQYANIHVQTAHIAEEIERTRQICARSLELLRKPVPTTFLGRKLFEPLPEQGEEVRPPQWAASFIASAG